MDYFMPWRAKRFTSWPWGTCDGIRSSGKNAPAEGGHERALKTNTVYEL